MIIQPPNFQLSINAPWQSSRNCYRSINTRLHLTQFEYGDFYLVIDMLYCKLILICMSVCNSSNFCHVNCLKE